jgi:hypothetical protein
MRSTIMASSLVQHAWANDMKMPLCSAGALAATADVGDGRSRRRQIACTTRVDIIVINMALEKHGG